MNMKNRIFAIVCFVCVLALDVQGMPALSEFLIREGVSDPDDIYWERGPNIQGLDGTVRALVVYDGLIVAGGDFRIACDTTAYRIAAWDGSSWTPLGSGVNAVVHALTVYNGLLTAGGELDVAGGVSAQRVAAWDGSSWSSTGLQTNYMATSLTVFDGELIAGIKSGNDHGLIRG
jgi:hypothetical protein